MVKPKYQDTKEDNSDLVVEIQAPQNDLVIQLKN
jgi:hypothetical protein